jgi:hypothetical protein
MSLTPVSEMENESEVCPICGESKDTAHLFKMYSELLNGSYPKELQGVPKKQLTIMVSPPLIEKTDSLSSIHPDVMAFILLIVFVYLFAIQLAEKGTYTIVYGLGIGVLLIAYWFFRQKLMARYEKIRNDRQLSISNVRVQADIWMAMVYCKKDDLVFTPDHKVQLKLAQLREYWHYTVEDQG